MPPITARIPPKPPSGDFIKLIMELEGSKRQGYLPYNNQKQIIGHSGVTIGKGLDLGQQSVESLRSMGLSEALIARFTPYLGLKKQQAADFVANNPLQISREEELDLNSKVVSKYWQSFNKDFEKYVGYKASELPEGAQHAAASRYFNNGAGIFKRKNGSDTNFLKQLRSRDFEAAGENLSNWNSMPELQRRYKIEGNLWKSSFANEPKKTQPKVAKPLKHIEDLRIASAPKVSKAVESPLKIVSRLTPQQV